MDISSALLIKTLRSDLDVFLDQGPERSVKSFAAQLLMTNILKKEVSSVAPDADHKALNLFLKVNEELIDAPRCETLMDEGLLGELKSELYRFFYPTGDTQLVDSNDQVAALGRVGPGSSLGALENDFYSKLFNSPLAVTHRWLYDSYRESCSQCPTWATAEVLRSIHFGAPGITECNKLLFVPKRNDISRTICVEPSLNMFYQLGLGRIIEHRLRTRYSITLDCQQALNSDLARKGSCDDSFATIDLSSASDSMSLGVLRSVLPRSFYTWLCHYRTPNTELPDGRVVPLRMISTMGNGFTFPLETMLFTAVVAAAYRLLGIPLQYNRTVSRKDPANISLPTSFRVPGNFGVYGDDIIVVKKAFHAVKRLLWLLGFTPNADKTFFEGPFRESCGFDAYKGVDVRPVFLKSLETPQDRYVAINRLNDWSTMHGIPLPCTIQYLLRTVHWVLIPPEHGFDEGIHVPYGMRGNTFVNENGAIKYRFYKAKPYSRRVQDCGSVPGLPFINPPGLLIALLGGYIRSHKIVYRSLRPSYRMKGGVTPRWDFMPLVRSYRRFDFARWSFTVYVNFCK